MSSFEAKEDKMSTIAGTMNNGINDISISAPIDIKNSAENTSLSGIVMTFAIAAVLDSATRTPAKKAPITTDSHSDLAANDNQNARPSITILSSSKIFTVTTVLVIDIANAMNTESNNEKPNV